MPNRFLLLFFIFSTVFIPGYPALLRPEQPKHPSLTTIIQSLETVEIQILASAVTKEIQSFLEIKNIPLSQNPNSDLIFSQLFKIIVNAYGQKIASVQEILGMCVYFEKAINKILERTPLSRPDIGTPFVIFLIFTGAFVISLKINNDQDFYNSDWISFTDIAFWEILLSKEKLDLIKDQYNMDEKINAVLQNAGTYMEKLNVLKILLRSCKKNSTFIDQIYTECLQNQKFSEYTYSCTFQHQGVPTTEEKSQLLETFLESTQDQVFINHIHATVLLTKKYLTSMEKTIFLQKLVYGETIFLIEQRFLKFINFDLYIDPGKEFLSITERVLNSIIK
ncbi:MAG: hypothetical protein WCS92_05115 [Candidatus Babeliales bacterium]|jgi:hypothetical protein